MKKVLFVATVTKHINAFHIPYLKWFKENGYEVHVASNGEETIEYCDKHFNLNFARFPMKLQNIKVYQELKSIIEENKYEIIHCHTPVGGVLTRLAVKKSRKKYNTKVIYTAHGFHFYKGAPLLNWIIYYPIEKWMSKYTDWLITINKEDYDRAKKKFSNIKNIEYVHGVGFNSKRLDVEIDIEEYKKSINLKRDDVVLSYIAELNKNKNQILLINCIERLADKFPNIKLLLIGKDNYNGMYEKVIREKKMQDNIKLLGNRNDIGELLSITDIYVASSLREGLPVNVTEAMYKKLPIIAFNNRGHRELINNGENGFIINNEEEMVKRVEELINNKQIGEKLGKNAYKICEKYKSNNVMSEMIKIYKKN